MATLKEIEDYFLKADDRSVPWDCNGIIHSTKKFAEAHIATLKAHSGNRTFMPYWLRLEKLYNICLDQDEQVERLINNG
jgi:hypothetical protein